MPSYALLCPEAHYTTQWQSIHDDTPIVCEICGRDTVKVIERVATYAVGDRGAQTRDIDARERRLDLDRPAYKRLRDEGHQPMQLRGAHELEARATNDWQIKTGMHVSVPDHRVDEINEMCAEAKNSSWSPVEQMHTNRST